VSGLLDIRDLTCRFRGLVAVDGVSFSIAAGTVHGIIGPNGAGKTTLFNLISGLTPASAGEILLDGSAVTDLPPYRRTAAGLARTFQNIRVFGEMTLLENVLTGMHARLKVSALSILLRLGRASPEERVAKERALALLAEVGLADRAGMLAASLSYGDQRRLEIARALASEPKLLLLDEPAAGMNPTETEDLKRLLRSIAERGVTLALIEHDMRFVMSLCDRLTVLNFGRLVAEGIPREIRENRAVIEAYLGPKLADRLARKAS
jgi:branched-chain amino acid transport system ATP-binding protein